MVALNVLSWRAAGSPSIIALRAAAAGADPAGITGVMLLATLATTLVGRRALPGRQQMDSGAIQLCGLGVYAGHCPARHGKEGDCVNATSRARKKDFMRICACTHHALHAQRHCCG